MKRTIIILILIVICLGYTVYLYDQDLYKLQVDSGISVEDIEGNDDYIVIIMYQNKEDAWMDYQKEYQAYKRAGLKNMITWEMGK